jgi:hypothetical protein
MAARSALRAAKEFYGRENEANGVHVRTAELPGRQSGEARTDAKEGAKDGKLTVITLDSPQASADAKITGLDVPFIWVR